MAVMHGDYTNAKPVRLPTLVQRDLGQAGWARLHELAEVRGRSPKVQAVMMLKAALARSVLEGIDPEPTQAELDALDDVDDRAVA